MRQHHFFEERQFTVPSLVTRCQLSLWTYGVNPPWRAGGWSYTFPAQTCDMCNQLRLTLLSLGWQKGHLVVCPWHKYLFSMVIPGFQGVQYSSDMEFDSFGLSLWEYVCAEGGSWISACLVRILLIVSREALYARWGDVKLREGDFFYCGCWFRVDVDPAKILLWVYKLWPYKRKSW